MMTRLKTYLTWPAALSLLLGSLAMPALSTAAEQVAETGTDPRDFGPKFMPYYRYTELENGLEVNVLTLFGLDAFSRK